MKKKDKTEYEKRANAMKDVQNETANKKSKKEDNPDYVDLMKRMRQNLEEKKTKSKTEKSMRKQKIKGICGNVQ